MPRISRNEKFIQMRVQKDDHEWLFTRKHGSADQLDVVLHRILGEFKDSEKGALEFLYYEQVKITQNWMNKYRELEAQLRARNMVLDQVLEE